MHRRHLPLLIAIFVAVSVLSWGRWFPPEPLSAAPEEGGAAHVWTAPSSSPGPGAPPLAALGAGRMAINLPYSVTLSITVNGPDIDLNWSAVPTAVSYDLHRSSTPFFSPSPATLLTSLPPGSTSYSDLNTTGDPNTNYFYHLQALDGSGDVLASSNQVGEIDYPLNNTGGQYSLIALPFPNPSLTDAASLAAYIGSVEVALKWNPATQTFRFFVPPATGDNFSLSQGDAVFISVSPAGPAVVTMAGPVTAVQHQLGPGGFNFISLPLQRFDLVNAAGVAADVTNVGAMLGWNEVTQAFRFFVPPATGDNFLLRPGRPFALELGAAGPTDWPAITISDFSPDSGLIGTTVSLTGGNFIGASEVAFNDTPALSYTVDSLTQLRAEVPLEATSGPIRVTNPGASGLSPTDFTVLTPPIISGFSPPSGPVGTEVTITGTNFISVTEVAFNGLPAQAFTIDSDSQLRTTVPSGATSGPISLTTPSGSASSAIDFIVTTPPVISGFSPNRGPVGTEVTITGSNLISVTEVAFNGFPAQTFTVDSDSQLRTTVPFSATTGPISASGPNGTGVSAEDFIVNIVPTEVCGTINANTTWIATESPYLVTCNITVSAGVTLTLEAGTIVKFQNNNLGMAVNGILQAQGTIDQPIYFTSYRDDSVAGDTNGDEDTSSPAQGDWDTIAVAGTGRLLIDNSIIRYGGNNPWGMIQARFGTNDVEIIISNSSLEYSGTRGVYIEDAEPTTYSTLSIINSKLRFNAGTGIQTEGNGVGDVILSSNVIDENRDTPGGGDGHTGAEINSTTLVTVTDNTFSNSNFGALLEAPAINLANNLFSDNIYLHGRLVVNTLTITGNTSSGPPRPLQITGNLNSNVILSSQSLVYQIGAGGIQNNLAISEGYTLTIEPGVVLKTNGRLTVRGTLAMQGSDVTPVVLTSLADDGFGGDTNGDGNSTSPAPADWDTIDLQQTGRLILQNTLIRYGGNNPYGMIQARLGNTSFRGVSVDIRDSILEYSGTRGVYIEDDESSILSTVSMGGTTIQFNAGTGVEMEGNGVGDVILSGNIFDENRDAPGGGDGHTGAEINSTTLVTVTDNTFSNSNFGAFLEAPTINLTDNLFANNASLHGRLIVSALTINGNTTSGPSRLLQITGNLNSNVILSSQSLVYQIGLGGGIQNDLTISEGYTLTVEPGVVLKTNGRLTIFGSLVMRGTETDPVVLTSLQDDIFGGDTNADGNGSAPAAGDWATLAIANMGRLVLDRVIIRYGGNDPFGMVQARLSSISASGVEITIRNSVLEYSSSHGVYIDDDNLNILSTLSITNSTIRNNDGTGIRGDGTGIGDIVLFNNSILDNEFGVWNGTGQDSLAAENNWWGSDSGPAPYGSGNGINYSQSCTGEVCTITYYVDADPWLGKEYWQSHHQGQGVSWQGYESDPVNTATGNYTYNRTDLSIPTRSQPLAFSRAYNSVSPQPGPLGMGWTHSYHLSASENLTDNTVLITYGDGRQDKFVLSGTTYLPPAGTFSQLEAVGGGFELTMKDQTLYSFDAQGRLASIVDKNGNSTNLSYSGDLLSVVTEPAGRSLTLTYDAQDRISLVTGPLGRSVGYGYDGAGNLAVLTDTTGLTTSFTYTSGNRLSAITDANGHTFLQNVYNSEGRVIEQRDALDNPTTFSYDLATRQTTVTDPLGRVTRHTYDPELRLLSERDALNQTLSYSYDSANNRVAVVDKRGFLTRYRYDTRGNTTAITDALGSLTQLTYDGRNNLLSYLDPLGRLTQYGYDPNSNLIQSRDALSNVTSYGYDGFGQLTSVTDARGNTTSYQYDPFGHQTGLTDPLGNTTAYSFDLGGRRLSESDPLSNTTTYTYDEANRLLTISQPLGKLTAYSYDAVGNRTAISDPRGGVTRFRYDAKDRLIQLTDPLSNVTSYTYDAVDNQLSITNPLSNATSYSYDPLNRRLSVSDPLGNTTSYQYDPNGNRTRLTDALGRITQYSYDPLGRLQNVTDAAGGTVGYGYDPVGNRTVMTDANGNLTTYSYDPLDRLLTSADPLSNTTSYSYDPVGNRVAKSKPDGSLISYSYDPLDRLSNTSYPGGQISYSYDPVGNRTTMTDTAGLTSYSYDDLYRLTSVTAPTGTLGYGYDLNDNRTQLSYPSGQVVSYTYDLVNRLTSVEDPELGLTSYSYDANSRQTTVNYPNGVQAAFNYDVADRLTNLSHSSPLSGTIAVFSYTLDAVGNRLSMQDLDGTISYSYDPLYRLTSVTYPDGEQVSYSYDPMGNRTQLLSSAVGTTTYSYDAADRLLSFTDPSTTTLLSWDANGNLLSKGGATFSFDPLDRLVQVISGSTTVQFAYNGDGGRVSKVVNGSTTDYVQDVAAPLPMVLLESQAGQASRYLYGADLLAQLDPPSNPGFYHPDGLGSTRALSNQAGQRTDSYSYDAFGALRTHAGSSTPSFTFTGEQADPELGLIFLRARYYDPILGRFISSDRFPGFSADNQSTNSYVYAQNRPTNYSDPNGEFIITALAIGVIGYVAYEAYTAWNDYLLNAQQLEENLSGYYEFDFDNPEWQEKYEDYDPGRDVAITARSGAYAALKTPGTSVTGPPPTSLKWNVPAGFALKKLILPDFEKPSPNRILPVGAQRSPDDTFLPHSSHYSGGGFGGGGGGAWGGAPGSSK